MSRYYFDLYNGDGLTRDDDGLDLRSRDTIPKEVSRILTDIARDEVPGQVHGNISVTVRDENAVEIFQASLSFRSKWL